MLWEVQNCFLLVSILNLYKMKLPVFHSSVLQKSTLIENQYVDGTTWFKGRKPSVLELHWGEFHPHQAIQCCHEFRACWWSWPASPALLVSGVDYSGAKSGSFLNTAAHWSGNSGCDCGKPTVYRGLVEWVLHVNLMVHRRIITVVSRHSRANIL